MKKRDVNFIDILPTSINYDKEIKAMAEAMDPYLNKIWENTGIITIYKNIDTYGHDILDHLAYQFHVDFYKDDLPLVTKRALVKNSIRYHRHKGTPWAVENLLSTLFNESWLEEWYEYGGKPYFFKVYTKDNLRDKETYLNFMAALNTVKNTRSWLESFVLVRQQTVHYGIVSVIDREKTMYQRLQSEFEKEHKYYQGMANILSEKEITYKFPSVYFIKEDGINVSRAYYLSKERVMWK